MYTSQVVIRQARATDSLQLQALYKELTGDDAVHVLPERVEDAFQDPCTCLLIAEVAGTVCGTSLVSLCADVMYGNQPFAVVENIIVESNARSHGIGQRLMQGVESFCLEHDCSKIMLLSSASRIEAHTFFKKAGFSGDKKRGFVKYRREFGESVTK